MIFSFFLFISSHFVSFWLRNERKEGEEIKAKSKSFRKKKRNENFGQKRSFVETFSFRANPTINKIYFISSKRGFNLVAS